MKRTDRLLLADMRDAIVEVSETTPASESVFHGDKLVRSHVLRNIQIIGEAASRLTAGLKDRYPQVPWRAIIGMRHALVHDYFEVDWGEVYRTAVRDAPILLQHIEGILASLPDEHDQDERSE